MFKTGVDLFRKWSKRGMYWPFLHDPVANKPSVTLMFFYLSFVLANMAVVASSTLMVLKGDYLTATFMPTCLLILGFIFYRLRSLDKVKIDLNDQEIELSGSDEDEPKKAEPNE